MNGIPSRGDGGLSQRYRHSGGGGDEQLPRQQQQTRPERHSWHHVKDERHAPPPTLPGIATFLRQPQQHARAAFHRSSSQESNASSGSGDASSPPQMEQPRHHGEQRYLPASRSSYEHLLTSREEYFTDAMMKPTHRRSTSQRSSYSDTDGSPNLRGEFKNINLRAPSRHSFEATTSSSSALSSSNATIMSSNYKSKHSNSSRPLRTSRYLREIDRRNILRRIENGEKQADLAKEYQVSRAAISNLKQRRNRKDLREEEEAETLHTLEQQQQQEPSALKQSSEYDRSQHRHYLDLHHHPQQHPGRAYERQYSSESHRSSSPFAQASSSQIATAPSRSMGRLEADHHQDAVVEVKIATIEILFAQLLDSRTTDARTFHVAAKRVIRLLLEHAMSVFPARDFTVATPSGSSFVGTGHTKPTCAVAVTDRGVLLLREFQAIEPYSETGYISFPAAADSMADAVVQLPPSLRESNILLLDSLCSRTGQELAMAVEAILAAGGHESDIYIATVLSYEEGLHALLKTYRRVHVLTAKILSSTTTGNERSGCPAHDLVGYFHSRLFHSV